MGVRVRVVFGVTMTGRFDMGRDQIERAVADAGHRRQVPGKVPDFRRESSEKDCLQTVIVVQVSVHG